MKVGVRRSLDTMISERYVREDYAGKGTQKMEEKEKKEKEKQEKIQGAQRFKILTEIAFDKPKAKANQN